MAGKIELTALERYTRNFVWSLSISRNLGPTLDPSFELFSSVRRDARKSVFRIIQAVARFRLYRFITQKLLQNA